MLEKLKKSPINYFSDLFIVVMVLAWIAVILIMVAMGIYSTVAYADNSIWCEVSSLVSVPLSAGGAIWMIKNSVQHAIANNNGKRAHEDFPAVDASETIDGQEEPMDINKEPFYEYTEGLIKKAAELAAESESGAMG